MITLILFVVFGVASEKRNFKTAIFSIRLYSFSSLLPLLFVLALPVVTQAQFILTTNNGAITITHYIGSGTKVVVPSATNGLPVTSIGDSAFFNNFAITSVALPRLCGQYVSA
ncbi:MAG TPA: hypothetical protein VHY30_02390 [Verrucomicrobiae bacterium]|nr:hypothetical protein [Verrucomicrobiae bacterium]